MAEIVKSLSLEEKYRKQCEARDKMERAEELWDDPQTYVPRRDYQRPIYTDPDPRSAMLEQKVEKLEILVAQLHQQIKRMQMGLTPEGETR